jgi:hypothetical protein
MSKPHGMKRNWGGFCAPYIALGIMLVLVLVLVGRCAAWHRAARSPGVFVCSFENNETLRVHIVEGWRMQSSRGWFYFAYGAKRPTTYWPVGGETCEIQR